MPTCVKPWRPPGGAESRRWKFTMIVSAFVSALKTCHCRRRRVRATASTTPRTVDVAASARTPMLRQSAKRPTRPPSPGPSRMGT